MEAEGETILARGRREATQKIHGAQRRVMGKADELEQNAAT